MPARDSQNEPARPITEAPDKPKRTMKHISITSLFVAATAGWLLISTPVQAEERVVTTTTSTAGTISEFSPDQIVVKSTTSSEPLRYGFTRETTYVDEAGQPVSIQTIRSGLPVTVDYVQDGSRVIARRVIVHRTVAAPPQLIEKRTTTTTTTTHKKDKDDDDDDDKD
jgi:hypothetical protein